MSVNPVLELAELPTVDRIDVSQFHATFVARQQPVRIRGAIDHWPALRRWSPADFVERFGDYQVDTYAMQDGHIILDPKTGFQLVRMSIREYVEHLLEVTEPRFYLRAKLGKILPQLLDELTIPAYCANRLALRYNLWFSGKGTVTALHFDLPHNLVAQVYGSKRFLLFPHTESHHLYREPWLSATPHLARVDPEAPDFSRYPRLLKARGYACTLVPGDLLFIPSRFWHHANSLTPSISTNFWWASPALLPFVKLSDLYKRVRGLNI